MVWAVPKQLQGGKYTLESVLGRGRFGITYLAKDEKGDRIVVKTLDDQLLNQPDFKRLQERFVQEAFKLAKCKHPHIVRLLEDPFQEDDLWCIAMEYIAGIDLAHRPQNILAEADALQYIQQIGEALTVVHQNNLVHRDIKPANIMIRAGSKEAVLIDFGLARGIDSKKLSVSNLETEAEAGFTPPELYSHTIELGAYTDVYSLAATLYNLLTGQVPTSAKERLQNHTPLPEPTQLNPQISHNINRDILWAMDLDPKKRPQCIEAWLDSLGLKPTPVVQLQPTQINYDALGLWIGIIGLILAIIAIFTGIFQGDIRDFFIKLLPSPTEKSTPTPLPTKPPN
ncbi:serine/threonine protein kinase [Desmonostoc muscorum LEGE 12446]|uniref:Serine/threonine protein kinase n=1 Tax=Desmonostoc muscorum LEGE 12446 TaxID=1828758 RepID=A0A8J7D9F3_DESMC|nr:serine/threonine-protein kinase [Desmonostoc muscorum]MCF2149886.1 serine/threonine protein kinase [Desmonostoc muscorum LEGE 12446]